MMGMKITNLHRAEFKDIAKMKVKKMVQSILVKFHSSNSEWCSLVCIDLKWLYACLTVLEYGPNEVTDGVHGDLLGSHGSWLSLHGHASPDHH